jgi:hypothetical protein
MDKEEMTGEAKIIMTNLENYPLIKKFLGNIIRQRLQIECFTHGALTAHLLEFSELTKVDLERLEIVFQFANSCCDDFDLIFQEEKLSQHEDADAKILDILAEVKAFEFLCRHGFRDIAKMRRKPDAKTVDFTAKRISQNYAVEVTRLGLASSEKKQPVFSSKVSTLDYSEKCVDAGGLEVSRIDKGLNKERIERDVNDAIERKYPQIKEFCQAKDGAWRGILFMSSGRDYFAMRRYENKGYEQTPKGDFYEALGQIWQYLKGQQRDKYLHHLVITRGKDLGRAIISPDFEIGE